MNLIDDPTQFELVCFFDILFRLTHEGDIWRNQLEKASKMFTEKEMVEVQPRFTRQVDVAKPAKRSLKNAAAAAGASVAAPSLMDSKKIHNELRKAAKGGDKEMVEKLLGMEGIKVDAMNSKGVNALILAVAYGHAEIVELLIYHGADVYTPPAANGRTVRYYLRKLDKHKKLVIQRLLEGCEESEPEESDESDQEEITLVRRGRNNYPKIKDNSE